MAFHLKTKVLLGAHKTVPDLVFITSLPSSLPSFPLAHSTLAMLFSLLFHDHVR